MRKLNNGLTALLAATLSFGSTFNHAKGDVYIEFAPENLNSGVTEITAGETKRFYINAINDEPSTIDGADWISTLPSHLSEYITIVDQGRPSSESDFFSGSPLLFGSYNGFDQFSGAVVQQIGGGAQSGHSGNLQYFDLAFATDAPEGDFDFNLAGGDFVNQNGSTVPSTVTDNYQFRIVAPVVAGDIDGNGSADANDIPYFVGAQLGTETNPDYIARADMNNDGTVDGRDTQYFVDALTGN